MNGLALCAGVGGLELGLELALGERYRTVGYVERDAYGAATLVARMEDKALAPAPIWDDLFTFDPRPWRGKVDLVTAGFPCQPFSVAGKQRAEEDERHLFPRIAEIIRDNAPDLFARAVLMDGDIRKNGTSQYLHAGLKPLGETEFRDENQPDLFGNECEGICGV